MGAADGAGVPENVASTQSSGAQGVCCSLVLRSTALGDSLVQYRDSERTIESLPGRALDDIRDAE